MSFWQWNHTIWMKFVGFSTAIAEDHIMESILKKDSLCLKIILHTALFIWLFKFKMKCNQVLVTHYTSLATRLRNSTENATFQIETECAKTIKMTMLWLGFILNSHSPKDIAVTFNFFVKFHYVHINMYVVLKTTCQSTL